MRSYSDQPMLIEAAVVTDVYSTGLADVVNCDGHSELIFYRDRRFYCGREPEIERVIVARIIVPTSCVSQIQRALAGDMSSPQARFAISETVGRA